MKGYSIIKMGIALCIGVLGLFCSCENKDNVMPEVIPEKEVSYITLYGEDGKYTEPFFVNDSIIHIVLPSNSNIFKVKIKTNKNKAYLIVDSYDLGTAGIRGRGHSSWGQPKKPYNVKFDKKQSPLGMSKSKHWILLANAYYDRTQLHNATAFEMARLVGFDWGLEGRFVELILNGTHKGLYYLCEKIRAEKDKINIHSMDETSGDITTGWYLLESHVVLVENDLTASYPANYIDTSVLDRTGDDRYPCVLGREVKNPYMSLNDVCPIVIDKRSIGSNGKDYYCWC